MAKLFDEIKAQEAQEYLLISTSVLWQKTKRLQVLSEASLLPPPGVSGTS
jgi:hypothetical protein